MRNNVCDEGSKEVMTVRELCVLYITDEKFAPLVGVSVTSLFINNPAECIALTVYILTPNMSSKNQTKFTDLAKKYDQTIHIIHVGDALEKIEKLNIFKYRGSAMTNLRLFFDKFIPQHVQRLLYIDADTIISGSIEELVDFDMQEKMLGMVHDAYGKVIANKEHEGNAYYNAGVILFDCTKWRKGMWRKRIIRYINRNGAQFAHPDQDIYNILCRKEIVCMPIRYNFQPIHHMYSDKVVCRHLDRYDYYSKEEIAEGRDNPAILHMVRVFGRNPWHIKNAHPFDTQYKCYKELSPWKKCPDEKAKIGLVIRIEICLHKILPEAIFFPLSLWAIRVSMK